MVSSGSSDFGDVFLLPFWPFPLFFSFIGVFMCKVSFLTLCTMLLIVSSSFAAVCIVSFPESGIKSESLVMV